MISFERITIQDLPQIMEWRMKEEVTKYMYTDPKLTLEKQLDWFKKITNDKKCRYWTLNKDGDKIGIVNLNHIDFFNKRCSWEYYIGDLNFRGIGIAPIVEYNVYEYVFEHIKFNKVWCDLMEFNKHAINIHKKMGSEVEGIFKQHIYKNGRFHDVVVLGITKEKWDKIKDNYSFEKVVIS
ncbi:UDP-4-amino-4,6-dideoxy-N-acetyl-beta-L-altrosamine N-acetyltransferase [Clostridium uliginosum]|uniref:UDP-4-amino-4,6-dideoxy-N-acetyl-beta-L-altrosamine N-acetyltransferase n=1 Tax=Clostridium uliginosum TaxID=119641 RepID=A0A1I1HKR9_9CLOT|nr:UDP-4-amino-4,6-dideoxy-N-acetyl-beta-L-altrosamine N-acetyltransferase [Clostridium uliginosum]SFC22558.1 UDP-4-amino-4,6-dideoxy-N-acetyl-beta-L-altrosamine N-acetyltransferase [Clostridium uliginosum]